MGHSNFSRIRKINALRLQLHGNPLTRLAVSTGQGPMNLPNMAIRRRIWPCHCHFRQPCCSIQRSWCLTRQWNGHIWQIVGTLTSDSDDRICTMHMHGRIAPRRDRGCTLLMHATTAPRCRFYHQLQSTPPQRRGGQTQRVTATAQRPRDHTANGRLACMTEPSARIGDARCTCTAHVHQGMIADARCSCTPRLHQGVGSTARYNYYY